MHFAKTQLLLYIYWYDVRIYLVYTGIYEEMYSLAPRSIICLLLLLFAVVFVLAGGWLAVWLLLVAATLLLAVCRCASIMISAVCLLLFDAC